MRRRTLSHTGTVIFGEQLCLLDLPQHVFIQGLPLAGNAFDWHTSRVREVVHCKLRRLRKQQLQRLWLPLGGEPTEER